MLNYDKLDDFINMYWNNFGSRIDNIDKMLNVARDYRINSCLVNEDFAKHHTQSMYVLSDILPNRIKSLNEAIIDYILHCPKEGQILFRDLYNEDEHLLKRISNFCYECNLNTIWLEINNNYDYQKMFLISAYLWINNPSKYYLYKYTSIRRWSKLLNIEYKFKRSKEPENFLVALRILDEIKNKFIYSNDYITASNNLKLEISNDFIPNIIVYDFTNYISSLSKHIVKGNKTDKNEECSNIKRLPVKDWLQLMNDKDIFYQKSILILNRIRNLNRYASLKQLSNTYGNSIIYYEYGLRTLIERVNKSLNKKAGYEKFSQSDIMQIVFENENIPKLGSLPYAFKLNKTLIGALDIYEIDNAHKDKFK